MSPVNVVAMYQKLRCKALRNVLHITIHCAGLSAHLEQGNDKSRSHPADILVAYCDRGLSAACDVSVTSLLNPSLIVEAGTPSQVAARAAKERKHEHNDEKCSELGWQQKHHMLHDMRPLKHLMWNVR